MTKAELEKTACKVRQDIIKCLHEAGSGHPGGSLSCADIITAIYFEKMNIDPKDPEMKGRDKFVLSKGHAAPALYSVLAERGFYDPAELQTLRKVGSRFQGHPNMNYVPGVEMSTGSLGQGFSTAVGMALASKMDQDGARIYTIMGDGEQQEGIIWEAAMAAAHYKLDNITAFVDWNGLQIDGPNDEVMTIKPIDEKYSGFGWHVIQCDGHDMEDILKAMDEAETIKGKPTVIIAKTVKGKGVSFMENQVSWHGTAPNDEEYEKAMAELGGEQ